MSATRRQILATGLVAGTSLVGGLWAKSANATISTTEKFKFSHLDQTEHAGTEYPSKRSFAELIGDQFWIDMGPSEKRLQLTLEELVDIDQDTFIAVFKTRDHRKLSQDSYRFNHVTTGSITVFMGHNPVTQTEHLEAFVKGGNQTTAKRYYYEAVFNQKSLG